MSLRQYWALGRIIVPFILILAVVFPFFYGGQATVGPDTVALRTPVKDLTWASLGFGALLALRFLALGTAGLAFAFTTHPTDLVQSLSRRGWDYRLVHAPVLGLILFPSFLQLGREISITQRIRDLGQDTNWFRRKWIRIRHLAFAMLVLGLRNGQTQAMALDIRGYGAHKTRTFMRELPRHRGGGIFAWVFFRAVGDLPGLRVQPGDHAVEHRALNKPRRPDAGTQKRNSSAPHRNAMKGLEAAKSAATRSANPGVGSHFETETR